MPRINRSEFSFKSEPGDYIGQGKSAVYTDEDSAITVKVELDRRTIEVKVERGPENWTIKFSAPRSNNDKLKTGVYENAAHHDNRSQGQMGLTVSGCGRDSKKSFGAFAISKFNYNKPK